MCLQFYSINDPTSTQKKVFTVFITVFTGIQDSLCEIFSIRYGETTLDLSIFGFKIYMIFQRHVTVTTV